MQHKRIVCIIKVWWSYQVTFQISKNSTYTKLLELISIMKFIIKILPNILHNFFKVTYNTHVNPGTENSMPPVLAKVNRVEHKYLHHYLFNIL